MKALVRELPRLVAGSTVYASLLTIVHSCFMDFGNCILQILMHITIKDRMSDIVSQIEGAD